MAAPATNGMTAPLAAEPASGGKSLPSAASANRCATASNPACSALTTVVAATVSSPSTPVALALGAAVPRSEATEIGRSSGRERVCQYVEISVVAVSVKKQNTYQPTTLTS